MKEGLQGTNSESAGGAHVIQARCLNLLLPLCRICHKLLSSFPGRHPRTLGPGHFIAFLAFAEPDHFGLLHPRIRAWSWGALRPDERKTGFKCQAFFCKVVDPLSLFSRDNLVARMYDSYAKGLAD